MIGNHLIKNRYGCGWEYELCRFFVLIIISNIKMIMGYNNLTLQITWVLHRMLSWLYYILNTTTVNIRLKAFLLKTVQMIITNICFWRQSRHPDYVYPARFLFRMSVYIFCGIENESNWKWNEATVRILYYKREYVLYFIL